GKRMNAAAWDSLLSADLFVMMTDTWQRTPPKSQGAWAASPGPLDSPWIRSGDKEIIEHIKQRETPCLLAINKVDLTKDKSQLLPMLEAYSKAHEFAAIVPMSLRRN